jgi:hypothetical protein
MPVKSTWNVVHGCGHRTEHDLCAKHPSKRGRYARRLGTKDCTESWGKGPHAHASFDVARANEHLL